MHHVALDRARPHDGDLYDQVVEGARLGAWQHRHLRSALDLEDSKRVGLADHCIGARVLGRDRSEIEADGLVLLQEIEAPLHAAEHAKREAIDLHEPQNVDVVLVPFDHLAIGHRRGFDRHQLVEPVVGQHEAARVLGQVPRRSDQLPGKLQRQAEPPVAQVEVELGGMLRLDVLAPAPDRGRQLPDHVLGQAERLADIAQRATRAIADHRRAKRGMVAAIGLKHPLHDDLAALVLEVDVDVGRLAPLGRDEALEKQVVALRIDRGDAEDVADRRVRRRAAPLAEDVARPCEAHDGVHGEEIGRVVQRLDQRQLVAEDRGNLVRQPSG